MKDLYRVRFTIYAKEDVTLDLADVLVERIRKWIESKFGITTVTNIIPDWTVFLLGAFFGNSDNVGEFSAETISACNRWA